MTRIEPKIRTRPARTPLLVGLSAAVAVVAVALAHQEWKPSLSAQSAQSALSALSVQSSTSGHRGELDEADGVVPDGTTVFDDTAPAVTGLDANLLEALRRAGNAAADDGVEFYVNSGWRSPDYQDQLLREAVAEYGSEHEAARWVATATTSPHVSGEAIDVGRRAATAWLSEHGAGYGLCQIYRNEPWHYELRPEAADRGCPRMYADPTEDPRMSSDRQ
ncbi:D-alanyl-D-alanine carboxypeptidase [Streptomyces sp. YIM 130001]|uniref:M15 family metallopeptidase n=1 Tax=Streptomyces sp. YIM 130001 TaxID=2259644 RepID=UPI000E659847|nr:M15 family metallopeptidase [Streptomyces sp. YIM 130001]RII15883.1 D-alanyl-D-alanine carboxypeptidase [Streptomyces sp. YIM 130001]